MIRRPAHPRDLNTALLQRAANLHRYMAIHVEHDPRFKDIATFQTKAHAAAHIENGARSSAKPADVKVLIRWMQEQLIEHERNYCLQKVPDYLLGSGNED